MYTIKTVVPASVAAKLQHEKANAGSFLGQQYYYYL